MKFVIFTVCLFYQALVGNSALHRRASNDFPALIGVDSDNNLVARDLGYGGTWENVQGSCCVTSIAVMEDGRLLGVGNDGKLYTKQAFDVGTWTGPVENSCCIQDVAILSDGSILGVSTTGKLLTRPDLSSEWTKVRNSLGAVRIDIFTDGRILGVSKTGSLKIRDSVLGRWTHFVSKAFRAADISIQPDGSILGISEDTCGVHVYDDSTGTWREKLPDSQCMKAIVSPGNLANLEEPEEPIEEPCSESEWTLVFKGVAGIGGNLYSILTSKEGLNEDEPAARALTAEFNGHYKNNLMDHWEAIGVTEVKLALYTNGEEVVSMLFNGCCTDKENWFSLERLRSSPFRYLMDKDNVQFFSMIGDQRYERRFFINDNYGGCNKDAGWLVVVDDGNTACSWSQLRAKPYFMYSPDPSKVTYESGTAELADVLAISIKHKYNYVEPVDEGWELVLKAVKGAGSSVHYLWTSNNGALNEDNNEAKELNTNFPDHYKSAKVDHWADQAVRKVKVAIYEGGREKMYMIFDGQGSDKNNWFSKDRLLHSSYSDLDTGTGTNYFSISGHGEISRRFFVNKHYGGCAVDAGWLVVVDPGHVACDWSTVETHPYFLYGKAGRAITYQSGSADVGSGDVFAIFIKS